MFAPGLPPRQPTDVYGHHPRDLVREAVRNFGAGAVVDICVLLLEGIDDFAILPVPLTFFGGAHAAAQLHRGRLRERRQDHWPRVWGARALQYAWADDAEAAVTVALRDPAWRVQEMSAKVVAFRELGGAADQLEPLAGSEVPRVRVAACRAPGAVGESEQAQLLLGLTDDDAAAVQVAAQAALHRLRLRLDRDV